MPNAPAPVDSLSSSVYKIKAVADLLGASADERKLQELTLPWISVLLDEELSRMEAALEHIDAPRASCL